ncbi:MAG: M48 family metalloprotease [Myxococcaceae bacterium]|nr:M48 family metalloprotease [Myxococcaceae bacterium]
MDPIYTPEQLAEVKAYHEPRYLVSAVDFVFTPLVLTAMVLFVTRPLWRLSSRLGERFEAWSGGVPGVRALARVGGVLWRGAGWAGALLFALLFFELFSLTDLPTEIGLGYFHEHAHGLSRTTPGVFAMDLLKAKVLFALAIGSLVFGLYGLARRTAHWWWLLGVSASVLMLGSSALDPYRARLYVEQTPLEAGPLRERITALMAQAGIDFQDVLVDQTSTRTVRVQAYFAGAGPTRTIVLNDSLVKELSTDEVLAAVAHEAGHVNEPRWRGRVASAVVLVGFLALIEWLFRRSASRRWFGIEARADVRTLPVIALVFTLAMMASGPVSAAVSREREYAADRYAVELTKDVAAFRSMLRKAARVNKMDPSPPRWVVLRSWSHPPITDRLEALESVLH